MDARRRLVCQWSAKNIQPCRARLLTAARFLYRKRALFRVAFNAIRYFCNDDNSAFVSLFIPRLLGRVCRHPPRPRGAGLRGALALAALPGLLAPATRGFFPAGRLGARLVGAFTSVSSLIHPPPPPEVYGYAAPAHAGHTKDVASKLALNPDSAGQPGYDPNLLTVPCVPRPTPRCKSCSVP